MNVLLFDYDGVIANSLKVVLKTYNDVCEKYGLFPMNRDEFIHIYEDNFYTGILKLGMDKKRIPDLIEDFRKGFLEHKKDITLFDKMNDTVNELAKTHKVYIITSSETSVVKEFLKLFKINVSEVLGADVATSKIEKINMARKKYPDATFSFITDTSGDIKEGKKAGVFCYGVTWGYQAKHQLIREKPEKIFHSPKELLEFFK